MYKITTRTNANESCTNDPEKARIPICPKKAGTTSKFRHTVLIREYILLGFTVKGNSSCFSDENFPVKA